MNPDRPVQELARRRFDEAATAPALDRTRLIESGSHTPGVDVAAFGLTPNTAVRYEQPDPRLAGLLTDYHVLDGIEPDGDGAVDWMLPSWAAIRFTFTDEPIAVRLGNRVYDPLPDAALYGTTSRALRVKTHGGVTIGAGLSPLGWARLVRVSADRLRDQIVPLGTVLPPDPVTAVRDRLDRSDRGPAVKAILDAFFLDLIGDEHPDEPAIRALLALIADDATVDLAATAADSGIDTDRLRRVANRYFGFPPKTLLIRTRFLRSFLKAWDHAEGVDYSRITPTYHDTSHFLRDANRFLGMTPKRFAAMETTYLKICLRARAAVLGAATSAMHRIEP